MLDLLGKASSAYDAAVSAYKQASKKYNEVRQGLNFSELEGSQREEAKQYRADISTAGKQKRRGDSHSIFYGRLAVDETFCMQDYTNLQSLASHMQG